MQKPTILQKLARDKLLEKIDKKQPIKMGEIMREVGYSEYTSNNPEVNLTSKKGWQQLLAEVEDKPLIDRLREIAVDDNARDSISAIKELLTLKNRYPDKNFRISKVEDTVKDLFE